jgi:addiction module HigA family antidote
MLVGMTAKRLPPVHPGEILYHDMMQPLSLSINALAKALHVPVMRISEIVNGKRGITADTALRLARYFGTTPEHWLNLQLHYELRSTERTSGKRIAKDVRPRTEATR